MSHTTLKDIANTLGVSTTTVHRALSGKGGISAKMRKKILSEASEQGYEVNYAASSLKRHPVVIGVVLPNPKGAGRFYYNFLWQAINDCHKSLHSFNISIITQVYEDSAEDHCRVLKEFYEEHHEVLDGLITLPINTNDETTNALNAYCYAGIALVLFDIDVPGTNRLCCIAPHEFSNGSLAAEVLNLVTQKNGSVLIAGGSEKNSSHVKTIRGFTSYLETNEINLKPIIIHSYEDIDRCYELALELFKTREDIIGFYGCTARETIPLCQAAIESGRSKSISGIGNDLFKESAKYLREGILKVVIDKNNYQKGVLGFNTLFDSIVKKVPPSSEFLRVPSNLVVSGNLKYFEESF